MEESFVDRIKREHPIGWAWEGFKYRVWSWLAWTFDLPCWDFSQDEPRLIYYRSGLPAPTEEE